MNWARNFVILTATAILAGCSGLPGEGPLTADIYRAYERQNDSNFVLVPVTAEVTSKLSAAADDDFGRNFTKRGSFKTERLLPGDSITVQIWEADPDGVFSSSGSPTKATDLNIDIPLNGRISVPYAGELKAVGRTPAQLSRAIASALSQKVLDPQVQVSRKGARSNVTISTGVNRPGVYSVDMQAERLLDFVAVAGGSMFPPHEAYLTVVRGSVSKSIYLGRILANPSNNIFIAPGDQISIERRAKTFTAFGAVESKGLTEFRASELNVLEAIAGNKGLADSRADAHGVYLFRMESARVLREIGADGDFTVSSTYPVIYQLNLKDPNQYFFAKSMMLKDKDVIYVANASSVELQKFIAILGNGAYLAAGSRSLLTP